MINLKKIKPISIGGFDNFFISIDGFLYKKTKQKLGLVKCFKDKNGYLVTAIQKNKKRVHVKIHRVVFESFCGKISLGMEINHKDGNKKNNHFLNLEQVSHKKNMEHAANLGMFNNSGENNKKSKLKETDVLQIKKLIKNGLKNKDISQEFSFVKVNTISRIRHNVSWAHVRVK